MFWSAMIPSDFVVSNGAALKRRSGAEYSKAHSRKAAGAALRLLVT
jgi:hypothetical protein